MAALLTCEAELKKKLMDCGNSLLNPYETIPQLLNRLDNMYKLLNFTKQTKSEDVMEAFKHIINSIETTELLKHEDLDVRVSTVCCICQILRITAPTSPYCEDKLKDISHVLVKIFEKLPFLAEQSYTKAVALLDGIVRSKLYRVMWHLDEVKVWKHVIETTNSINRIYLISIMENLLTLVINERKKDVPVELFMMLLLNIKKKNEGSRSYKMVEKIFQKCAVKLKPLLRSTEMKLDEYSEIVGKIKMDNQIVVSTKGTQSNHKCRVMDHKCSGMEYMLKVDNIITFSDIYQKYGDIAKNCVSKTQSERSSLIDRVCDMILRLKKEDDITCDVMKGMLAEVRELMNLKVDVKWLEDYLKDIINKEEAAKELVEKRDEMEKELLEKQRQLKELQRSILSLRYAIKESSHSHAPRMTQLRRQDRQQRLKDLFK